MQARYQRNIKNGKAYDAFFPIVSGENITIRKHADVMHTVAFIPKVVQETLAHTAKLAPTLVGNEIHATCKNIWDFVYQHIAYKKDDDGVEQIRSPARTWRDRKQGVDCDCYTTFISSILTNLGIPHTYRITKYNKPNYQHIYPIVPLPNGKYITIDCVVEQYNYEEPFSQKLDTKMDLQFLNGIDGNEEILFVDNMSDNIDAQELLGNDEELLGRLFKPRLPTPTNKPTAKHAPAKILQKIVHATNRVNPATVLLRNGVLASMKLNLFKVAQRLKWAYLSDEEAKKKGVDPHKFQRLKAVRAKLESMFFGAGGIPDNLKNAILKGKGNKGNEVNGFGTLGEFETLSELLGYDYDGISGLGEPATAAAIASAAGIVGAIAGLLKSIGSIFPSKSKEGAEDFENTEGAEKGAESKVEIPAEKTVPPSIKEDGTANPASNVPPITNETTSVALVEKPLPEGSNEENARTADTSGEKSKATGAAAMWENNKKWMKPTLLGLGGAGILYLGYRAMSGGKAVASAVKSKSLNGIKRRKVKPTKRKSIKKAVIKKQKLFN